MSALWPAAATSLLCSPPTASTDRAVSTLTVPKVHAPAPLADSTVEVWAIVMWPPRTTLPLRRVIAILLIQASGATTRYATRPLFQPRWHAHRLLPLPLGCVWPFRPAVIPVYPGAFLRPAADLPRATGTVCVTTSIPRATGRYAMVPRVYPSAPAPRVACTQTGTRSQLPTSVLRVSMISRPALIIAPPRTSGPRVAQRVSLRVCL